MIRSRYVLVVSAWALLMSGVHVSLVQAATPPPSEVRAIERATEAGRSRSNMEQNNPESSGGEPQQDDSSVRNKCPSGVNSPFAATDRIVKRAKGQLAVLDQIFERTRNYYVKAGGTISRQQALLDTISERKQAADSAVAKMQASSARLECATDNLRGIGTQFESEVRAQNTALDQYKSAIKTFIVEAKKL